MHSVQSIIKESTRWSFITEMLSKLITPISNIVLARLLAPEAFGVLATVMMVLSFADMLADAGFQKYIIQKEFQNKKDEENTCIVAIWSNVLLALFIWLIICLYNCELARVVGNTELGPALVVASIAIPLNSLSSVQIALLKRKFKFKTLLAFRLIMIMSPVIVTIPLAYIGLEYWALIIGHIVALFFLAITTIIYSDIKLRLYFDISILKDMISFSVWTLIESISIWLTNWVDIFIVSTIFSSHYLGIYRMSMVSVNSLLAVVTGTIFPVLYSTLSRLQNSETEFYRVFFHILKRTSLLIIPLGVGFLVYSDIARMILFGSNWNDADLVIGLWGFTSCFNIIYCNFYSEAYRAKGCPRISLLAQVLHMAFLIPMIYVFSNSFNELVYARNLSRFQFIVVHMFIVYTFIKINPFKVFVYTYRYFFAACFMGLWGYITRIYFNNYIYDVVSILLCIIIYIIVLCRFNEERNIIKSIVKNKNLY